MSAGSEPERTGLERVAALAGRRVWVDAQLPPALARWLIREYAVDAEHVNDIGFLGEDDDVIFAAARTAGAAVVITKDDDFVRLLERQGPPPQVVWVTCGNVRNAALRGVLIPVWPQIAVLLTAGEPLVQIG